MRENYSHVMGNAFEVEGYDRDIPFSVENSSENLLICSEVLDSLGVNYRLVFGTLLGLYRDGGLIPHDTDVDIALALEEVEVFLSSLSKLEDHGFKVVRYEPDRIISIGRKDNYVDFYFFEDKGNIYNMADYYFLTKEDFEEKNTLIFRGKELSILANPEQHFLDNYGADWRTPIKGLHAHPDNKKRTR